MPVSCSKFSQRIIEICRIIAGIKCSYAGTFASMRSLGWIPSSSIFGEIVASLRSDKLDDTTTKSVDCRGYTPRGDTRSTSMIVAPLM